jgi:hypothetical protein
MAHPPVRPVRLRRRASLMRVINVPMRRLLRLPFATPLSGQLMLISFTGLATGKAYQQPVSYVPDGDTLLTPGGGKWKRTGGCGLCVPSRGHGLATGYEADRAGEGVSKSAREARATPMRLSAMP